ncbi:MAG TPA: hypothetical protein ENJ30_13665 [Desulfobulbaceae bacterium]|nr:hypothetical protein [Desulfobulbaceae bacterium]
MKTEKEKIYAELSDDEMLDEHLEYLKDEAKREQAERNEYRRLLKQSLYAFNVLRNQRISESLDTTYAMAAKIEAAFQRFDQ